MNALLQKKKEFDIATKMIGAGLIYLNEELAVINYSPIIEKFFKINQNLYEAQIDEFIQLEDCNLLSICKNVISSRNQYNQEIKNSHGIWFRMQIHPNINSIDELSGVIISFVNIHELKVKLEESTKFNHFYSNLLDTNPSAIIIYNLLKKEFSYISENLLKLAGYTNGTEQNNDLLWKSVIYKDDITKVKNHYNSLSKNTKTNTHQIEYRIVNKQTGKIIWLLSTSKIYKNNYPDNPSSIITSIQNINQVKNLKTELETFSSRVQTAFRSSNSAIWEWNSTEKNKIWWSSELYELTGWSEDKIKGEVQKVFKLIHIEDIEDFKNNMTLLLTKGIQFDNDIRIKTKHRGYLWFRVNGKNQEQSTKIVGTLTYIHQRKEAQNELKNLNEELERFAYLASHDLKEPLQTITSFISLIKEGYNDSLDSEGNLYIQFIDEATQRMISLINDLLIYSQLGNKSFQMNYYDSNDIIKDTLLDLNQIIDRTKAEIKIYNLPEIFCDNVQIRQLFQNLITNSLKYKKDTITPVIEIGCSEQGENFQFYVKDNGIGIDPKNFNKIFEVFKRLHSRNEYNGNGIGLANCRRIISNHNGNIWPDSTPLIGTTIFFTIPKHT